MVSKIFEYIPEAKEGKAHLDHVIDLCGEPPRGNNDILIVVEIIFFKLSILLDLQNAFFIWY